MDFQASVRTCLKEKYLDFTGRASRSEFWFYWLFTVLFSILINIILVFLPTSGLFDSIVNGIISLAFFIPNLAAVARRLHDTGRTGWWQIAPAAPLILFFIFAIVGADEDFLDFSVFITVILAIVVFVFLVLRGTDEYNRFGAPVTVDDWEQRRDKYNKERQRKSEESSSENNNNAESSKTAENNTENDASKTEVAKTEMTKTEEDNKE